MLTTATTATTESVMPPTILRLQTKDGTVADVTEKMAAQSGFLKQILEESKESRTVKIAHITGPILEQIVMYLDAHKDDPVYDEATYAPSNEFDSLVCTDLAQLLMASHALDIPTLTHTVAGPIAEILNANDGRADQIQKMFDLSGLESYIEDEENDDDYEDEDEEEEEEEEEQDEDEEEFEEDGAEEEDA